LSTSAKSGHGRAGFSSRDAGSQHEDEDKRRENIGSANIVPDEFSCTLAPQAPDSETISSGILSRCNYNGRLRVIVASPLPRAFLELARVHSFRRQVLIVLCIAVLGSKPILWAQATGKPTRASKAPLGEERTETYRVGVVVKADKGPCTGLLATLPVPMDWPEQAVTVLKEEKSPLVKKLEYKLVGGAKQMRVTIPSLPAGAEASVLLTLEVRRRVQLPPDDTNAFKLPEKLPGELKGYLLPSPYIECTDAKIASLAKELVAGKDEPWKRAEAIYDWVQANITYKNGELKGARQALADRAGDCEEMTALFIALCRASKIPARTVWVPGHCYPEFYLVDKSGQGHWLPCQAAGDRAFGAMTEFRPILQKGDNFRVPEKREAQHYVSEFLSTKNGQPSVKFVREKVDAE
jgi:hypothetical protein